MTLPLGRGDLFVLYTDGISEAMNAGGRLLRRRAAGATGVRSTPTWPSDELRERILGEVRRLRRRRRAARRHDDGAAVKMRWSRDDADARRRLRHLVRHRSQRRHGAARQPRHRSFRVSGNTQAIWPMAVSALGEIRVAVADAAADEARRIIDSHREDVGARVVRLRDEFDELQARIDYRFRDRGLLEHALTHKSRAAEDASGGVADNESLEFLGDAVLGLVVADALFHQYPTYDEGQKSKIKAAVVSTQSLARHAEQIRLGEHLILGRGEEKTGGRFKQALLADALRGADRRPSISTAGSKRPTRSCAAS